MLSARLCPSCQLKWTRFLDKNCSTSLRSTSISPVLRRSPLTNCPGFRLRNPLTLPRKAANEALTTPRGAAVWQRARADRYSRMAECRTAGRCVLRRVQLSAAIPLLVGQRLFGNVHEQHYSIIDAPFLAHSLEAFEAARAGPLYTRPHDRRKKNYNHQMLIMSYVHKKVNTSVNNSLAAEMVLCRPQQAQLEREGRIRRTMEALLAQPSLSRGRRSCLRMYLIELSFSTNRNRNSLSSPEKNFIVRLSPIQAFISLVVKPSLVDTIKNTVQNGVWRKSVIHVMEWAVWRRSAIRQFTLVNQ